ncbi:CoA transferase [Aureimonas fodinaquatilis]|uniref:CoA transferase n=1 Tax=Aureimonas fodinaquatilis TaxID=2565783 RepID=A0A5B0E350_9HYPH|nr:CoA transferase [Aureimonas fodinaquatilis]KAA0972180.1 CoA transferase [Aureimonas fodinaquatilis]
MVQALSGIKVLELASFIAGPYCAMMLADQGADVVKIERPGTGDENRTEPPFINGESAPFMLWNRNKRSVALDLKAEEDREQLLKLVDEADVLIENFRTGAMDRLGLDYETLKKRNPRLIYASISGYGRTGEFATKGGFDLVLQGFTGLMALTGPEKEGPHRMPIPVCDIAAGLYLTVGVLTALQARAITGKGQKVETSLFEAGLSLQLYEAAGVFATGEAPSRLGQKHRGVAPYQIFRTGTDHVTIGVAQQNFWLKFCDILERPDLLADARFASNHERVANIDELVPLIEEALVKKPAEYWLEQLHEAGVPCGVIQTTDKALFHDHARHREMVVDVQHPIAGATRTLGVPIKLSETPGSVRRPAPLLGEHTDEVLSRKADDGRATQKIAGRF